MMMVVVVTDFEMELSMHVCCVFVWIEMELKDCIFWVCFSV